MTAHARTCPGDHPDHSLRFRIGMNVPPKLSNEVVGEVRRTLADALAQFATEVSGELEIPECVAPQVVDAINRFLGSHQTTPETLWRVRRHQDEIFFGDATPDSPAPASGMWGY